MAEARMMNAYVPIDGLRRDERSAPKQGMNAGYGMRGLPGMRILSVTSEIFPLVKTGGLADVTGSLPKALSPLGIETTSLIPGYPQVMQQLKSAMPLATFDNLLGEKAALLHTRVEGL